MVPDWKTNKVYFSFLSRYDFKDELKKLKSILQVLDLKLDHIVGTKDFFCRDYMPIQISQNEFIQFKFQPDYLLNNPDQAKYITNTDFVFRKNKFLHNFNIGHSDLILDGGNVVKSETKVIITDKVADDNNLPIDQIKHLLEDLLKIKVIIIPRYPNEETGHADGLIRFIDEKTVLSINLDGDDIWKDKLLNVLSVEGLNLISLPKGHSPESDWRYINYLQVGNNIIVPSFSNNRQSDNIILPFMKDLFRKFGYDMFTIDSDKIAENGGVLNCSTWNILV